MKYVVFDIETKNIFTDVGSRDPAALDLSVIALYNSQTDEYTSYTEEEMVDMWPIIESADALVGFNSDHFDIPLLAKYYHGDLRHIPSIDILKTVFQSLGRRIGLDALAKATLGITKSGHGLQATTWWKQGEIEKIRKYCIQDVKVTHELFKYIRNNKSVKYHDGTDIATLNLDLSPWDDIEKARMTQSLPF